VQPQLAAPERLVAKGVVAERLSPAVGGLRRREDRAVGRERRPDVPRAARATTDPAGLLLSHEFTAMNTPTASAPTSNSGLSQPKLVHFLRCSTSPSFQPHFVG